MRVPGWLQAWSGGNSKITIEEHLRDMEWPVQRAHWVPGIRIFKLPILRYNCHTVLKPWEKLITLKASREKDRQTVRVSLCQENHVK